MHCGKWKILAGADRLLPAEVAVAGELFGIGDDVAAKPVHELGEGVELTAGRMVRLKVTYEADADGGEIDTVAFYVPSK